MEEVNRAIKDAVAFLDRVGFYNKKAIKAEIRQIENCMLVAEPKEYEDEYESYMRRALKSIESRVKA